ncbi:hypothetical protein [Paraflavitalea sp. CAU 1676]|uniref:hypothetical protein n=1 Tax=Paraflavitalea sp. CAU 1676 TaxID=3032598 RepID=UPI0023DB001E|nr:hypothetical protein [Paraflavitalea sp. CAU 1676]MDF2189313.1 hypothetical protein [Paraflavitalea sp. CAU 1676]
MSGQAKKEQVAITWEQLVLAIHEQLSAFNGDPALTQKKATQVGSWVWKQMLYNQEMTRKHMERLIYLVDTMRTLQKEYWAGQRGKLPKAKVAEHQVDHAVKILLNQLGYSIEELKRRHEQINLWDGPLNKG